MHISGVSCEVLGINMLITEITVKLACKEVIKLGAVDIVEDPHMLLARSFVLKHLLTYRAVDLIISPMNISCVPGKLL